MNKEKQNLVNLLRKIDQKQKELKQLKKEYKTAFSAISKSWKSKLVQRTPIFSHVTLANLLVWMLFMKEEHTIFLSRKRGKS